MKRRVLISGGTGLVGRFIVEDCLRAGFDVSVMSRNAPAADMFSQPVDFRAGTLDPGARQDHLFEGVTHFAHAAFDHLPGKYRGGEGDDPQGFWRANVDGSIALLEAAKRMGVERCVFLSSRAAYPPVAPGMVLDETIVGEPASLYGKVKLAVEQKLELMRDDAFFGISFRITGVYGAYKSGADHKWQTLFDDYLSGKEIAPRVATEVHGVDVASAVRIALTREKAAFSSHLFNVSDCLVDYHDLLEIVAATAGRSHPLPPRAQADGFNLMDTQRLRALDWAPGGTALLTSSVTSMVARP